MEEMNTMKNVEETMVNEGVEVVEAVKDNTNLQKGLAVAAGIVLVGAGIFATKKIMSKVSGKAFGKFRKDKDEDTIEGEFEEVVEETEEENSDEE